MRDTIKNRDLQSQTISSYEDIYCRDFSVIKNVSTVGSAKHFLGQEKEDKCNSSDIARVTSGSCSIMKFARLVAEGNLTPSVQTKYWQSIATQKKREKYLLAEKLSGLSRDNLTAHMRRALLCSFKHNEMLFDKRDAEACDAIKLALGWEPRIKLKAQALLSFSHDHNIKLPPELTDFINLHGGSNVILAKFVTMLSGMYIMTNWQQRCVVLVQFILSCDGVGDLLNVLKMDSLQVFQNPTLRLQAQAASYEEKKEHIITALLAVIGNAFKIQAPSDIYKDIVRVKRIESLARLCSSVSSLLKFFQTSIVWLTDAAEAWCRDMDIHTLYLTRIDQNIPEWMHQVTTIYENHGLVRAGIDYKVAMQVRELHKQGSEYMVFVQKAKIPSQQLAGFSMAHRMCNEMLKNADAFFGSDVLRPEPFVVYIHGRAGQGKSTLIHFIANDLLKKMGIPYNRTRDTYVRNSTQDHWDGYANQTVVVFDDFIQSRNSDDRIKELLELVRIKNNQPYPLKVAELSNKGNSKFTSPLVFITSNINIPRDINVADVKAMKRRRDIVVEVSVKENYVNRDGLVDASKIQTAFNRLISRDIYKFELKDAINDHVICTFESYWEFINYCAGKWRVLRHHESEIELAIDEEEKDSTEFVSVMDTPMLCALTRAPGTFPVMPKCLEAQGLTEQLQTAAMKFLEENGYVAHEDLAHLLADAQGYESSGIASNDWMNWIMIRDRITRSPIWKKLSPRKFVDPDVWNTICKSLTFLGGLLGLVATLYAFKQDTTSEEVEKEQAEAFASGDSKTIMARKETRIKRLRVPKEAQACSDQRGLNLIKQRFVNMLCTVVIESGSGLKHSINGVLIGSKLILVPYHLFLLTEEGFSLTIYTINNKFVVNMEEASYVPYEDMDAAVLIMPARFPTFPKQTQHFIDERDVGKFYMQDMAMLQLTRGDGVTMPLMQMVNNPKRSGNFHYELNHGEVTELELIDGVSYECSSVVGDCGSMLVWLHASVNRKIVGFHVAGGQGTGVSNILTHECVEAMYARHAPITLEAQCFVVEEPNLKLGVGDIKGLLYEGCVNSENQFRQPTKSTIKESLIHGVFPPTTAPAVLRPIKGVSPLELGVKKAAVPSILLDPGEMELAINEVLVHYETGKQCIEKRLLTLDESINGVEGCQWIRPLNMKTSPGYPYILERKKPGKLDYFSFDGSKWLPGEFMIEAISKREKDAMCGHISSTLFVDVLKDERRPLDKIESLKTRIFNTSPVDLNILIRKYFGAFAAHIMNNHVTHEIAVGINYHSEEWGGLYRRLKSGGERWIAGDYSNYDKTLPSQLMMGVAEIANRWYDDDYNGVRNVLMETLTYRYHLTNRMVFYHVHGNPSGNPLTTILNSLANMMLMRIAWYKLSDHFCPSMKYRFKDFVQLSVYGDDNVAVVPHQISWYNCVAISHMLSKVGVVYTPPKSQHMGDTVPYLQEEEVTYLKRYFRKEGALVFAPLQREVINEIPNWIRVSPDDRYATLINVEMAKQEMFHYGKSEYTNFCQILDKACTKRGLIPAQHPFEYYYTKWMQGEMVDIDPLFVGSDLIEIAHGFDDASLQNGAVTLSRPGNSNQIKLVAQSKTSGEASQAINEHVLTGNSGDVVDKIITANEEANITTIYPTTFEDMGEIQTDNYTSEERDIMTMTYPMPTLKGFLERPFMVSSGTWSSHTGAGASLFSFSLPRDLFRIASVFSKIKYFTYFRGDFKIGIRINGTKFHYGRIMLSWIPHTASSPHLNIKSLSCNKHIIASPSENEIREMVVPFAYPAMYYSLASLGGDLYNADVGHVVGMVLNPLQEGAAVSDVNYTVYVSCVDPKLDGPTTAEIPEVKASEDLKIAESTITSIGHPMGYDLCAGGQISYRLNTFNWQPNANITGLIPFKNFTNTMDPGLHKALPHDMALMQKRLTKIGKVKGLAPKQRVKESLVKKPMKLQAQGKTMANSSVRQEAIQKSDGVISGVALGVSRSLSALSSVPFLSGLKTGATFLENVGNVAKSFGFCKPNTVACDTLIRPKALNLANGVGIDNGSKLSIFPDNGVSPATQWMGGKDEEMLLSYITQTPSYLGSVEWYSDAERGEELFVWPVCPQTESSEMVMSSGKLVGYTGVPSMVGYIGKMFDYWRGSLRYTFQIVASGFHSGRIRISFEPFGLLEGEDKFSAEEGMNAPNVVIDVQRETEVALEVPFVFHNMWARAQEFIGVLHMDVINPLTHSQDVCPPVYINVWVAGGDNLQFAKYSANCCVLGQSWSAKVKEEPIKPDVEDLDIICSMKKQNTKDPLNQRVKLEAQGLSLEETRKGPFLPLAPCNILTDHGVCMGETVSHIKELTNIPMMSVVGLVHANGVAGTAMLNTNVLNPWGYMRYEDPLKAPRTCGALDWLKGIFTFARGSINAKMVPRYRVSNETGVKATNKAGSGVYCFLISGHLASTNDLYGLTNITVANTPPAQIFELIKRNPCVCQVSPVGMDIEFNIPYYSNCVCIPLQHNSLTTLDKLSSMDVPVVCPMYQGSNRMLANDTTKYDYEEYDSFYATGDDFVFGNLIGPPELSYTAKYYEQFYFYYG